MKAVPPGRLEKMLAPLLPPPRHGLIPWRLKPAGRAGGMVGTIVMRAVSLAGRELLKAAGRSGPLIPEEIKRIAFIKIDHLGDVLAAQPLIGALKTWNPSARITVFAGPASVDLLLRNPYVDEVEPVDAPWIKPGSKPKANLKACLGLSAYLRARSYDLAVDLRYHNRLDSLLLSLSGARFRLGFDAGGFGFWLTHCADWPVSGHESERQAKALAQFGIPVGDLSPVFQIRDSELEAAAAWLKPLPGKARPTVAIHVGAGNAVKRWMPDRFAWVAREMVRRAKARIVLLAGREEAAAGDPVAAAVPPRALVDLRGRISLGEMAAAIKLSSLFIGNDGGAAHIAAATGTPLVVIFSGTNASAQWAPHGRRMSIVEKWVPCKPCGRTECPFEQACLRKVSAEEVLERAAAMLAGGGQLHDNTQDDDG